MEIKVNVWQVGYTTFKDYVLSNKKVSCRSMGYVLIDERGGWQNKVWHLLNWSCWTSNKPANVHSQLDHCNSDVIFQIEGTSEFLLAKPFGWGKSRTLELAIRQMKRNNHYFWPFNDVKFGRGYVNVVDGKAYTSATRDGEYKEITW